MSWADLRTALFGGPRRTMNTLAVVMGALLLLTIAYQIGFLEVMIAPVRETVIYSAIQVVIFVTVIAGTIAMVFLIGRLVFRIIRNSF